MTARQSTEEERVQFLVSRYKLLKLSTYVPFEEAKADIDVWNRRKRMITRAVNHMKREGLINVSANPMDVGFEGLMERVKEAVRDRG